MKVYKTITKFTGYSGEVKIDGKKHTFEFTGGIHRINVPGRLTTADHKLQEAVERHSDYGRYFILEFDSNKEKIQIPALPKQNNLVQGTVTTQETAEAELIKNNTPIEVDIQPGIRNLSDAKDYLVKKVKGLTYSHVKNTKDAFDISVIHKVEFPGWDKWKEVKELNNK